MNEYPTGHNFNLLQIFTFPLQAIFVFAFRKKTNLILVTKEYLSKRFIVRISVLAVVLFLTAQTSDVLMSLNLLLIFLCTK